MNSGVPWNIWRPLASVAQCLIRFRGRQCLCNWPTNEPQNTSVSDTLQRFADFFWRLWQPMSVNLYIFLFDGFSRSLSASVALEVCCRWVFQPRNISRNCYRQFSLFNPASFGEGTVKCRVFSLSMFRFRTSCTLCFIDICTCRFFSFSSNLIEILKLVRWRVRDNYNLKSHKYVCITTC